ncbi:beta-xylosidase [Haloferula luteola]|uniref:Beta-xylosidase n=1 Tax=Haloferula luteola TaxID=595692 RepID=A0A840VBP7_9BACT|nr:family 43 glycosylhydrolase [Haloferula luteola]MBB5350311.1 beta-xylosidase [Haloferula luteola]
MKLSLLSVICLTGLAHAQIVPARQPGRANPILPAYQADPSCVTVEGTSYLFATLDPWGGESLGCWKSQDFKNWTFVPLNWPTKEACTSPTSKDALVWAPSVVKGTDGRFHMYVSVGNEIWAGVADHPTGPWKNALGDRPLIPENFKPGYHMIDAEAFIDEDGQAYLYWGSGWNWVNGKCWAVRLKDDMVTFDGEIHDVTPPHYFEAPFMVKHDGRYFLMYSSGRTDQTTYQVHYATGDQPFGPFTEGPNSPILSTQDTIDVISPGHHAVIEREGRPYILYHRHSVPFDPAFIGRQICVDELHFSADGGIDRVLPSHDGPAFLQDRNPDRPQRIVAISACCEASESTSAAFAIDDNYATRWAVTQGAQGGWLKVDLGTPQPVHSIELRPEYPWKPCAFSVESSIDGESWTPIPDGQLKAESGSPLTLPLDLSTRWLRVVFDDSLTDVSLWEIGVF